MRCCTLRQGAHVPGKVAVLRPREQGLVVVLVDQALLGARQGPRLGPLLHVPDPGYELEAVSSGRPACNVGLGVRVWI